MNMDQIRYAIFETSSFLFKRKEIKSQKNKKVLYGSCSEIAFGVPQQSILGPLLFNSFLCELFLFLPEVGIVNYADDDTPDTTNRHLQSVLKDLEQEPDIFAEVIYR